MNAPVTVPAAAALPDHTQLPDKDGVPVRNDQEPPQSSLLTESIRPFLWTVHPDGDFWIGEDCGLYWRLPRPGEPPLLCAVSPDWYCVLGVPPVPEGAVRRRSYVLWQERVVPLVVMEYPSGEGFEERDRTPQTGKFWIYEQGIRVPYYAIYQVELGQVEVQRLVKGRYRRQRPNRRGHYPIKPLGLELGIWRGRYRDRELPWLRWYDAQGRLLLNGEERVLQERREKEQAQREKEQAQREKEQAQRRAERLAERLRELGLDPEA
jgi:hypothetical protein